MKKNKRAKKIRNLVTVCVLSAILLTVSTYAWFIGLQTVRVNPFEVEIAAADGLALSVDGVTFSEIVTINEETQEAIDIAYASNTNSWTDLKPISTIGKMDADTNGSRMIIYEKSSLTATTKDKSYKGYRLLSEKLDNTGAEEADGYVAFDLFVKNISGEKYYTAENQANEEAIYLTYDSAVTVGSTGKEGTGIENSVRVAFAQIGRVEADEEASVLQGITCTTSGDVTGLCRDAQIWEPNDTKHVANAESWYKESCSPRVKVGEETECTAIADTKTYAVAKEIKEIVPGSEDNDREYDVDIYDGNNGYTQSITDGYLQAVDTFTETERGIAGDPDSATGANRNMFMSLAPNSVTKIRVYIYIEGQDIDNYDFAQLGKQIKVNFGFTKERYTTDDFTDETVSLIAGAENTKRVGYTATGDITDISTTKVVYDSKTTGFYYLETDPVTTFNFKDGETEKTFTFDETNGWVVSPTE